jgi:serpin B
MKKLIALTMALAMTLSLCTGCGSEKTVSSGPQTDPASGSVTQLAQPEYPEGISYPDLADYTDQDGTIRDEYWDILDDCDTQAQAAREQLSTLDTAALQQFSQTAMETFLSDTQGENRVCSPVNLYMALSILAEITDGTSRQQVLDALGAADIQGLRTQITNLVEGENQDREGRVAHLASSIWLKEGLSYNEDTISALKQSHYAASYQGIMGSDAMNQALQDWLNQQTQGLLEDQVSDLTLDPRTVIALVSTIYYKAQWKTEFREANNTQDVFHGTTGDTTCEFMNQSDQGTYYWGDQFSAISRSLSGGDRMWIILPDEGVEAESLLAEEQVSQLLSGELDDSNSKYVMIHASLPKFDVSGQMDLIEGLQSMGITDVFDPAVADFSPLIPAASSGLSVTEATHAARVKIDEEGVEAAAYTLLAVSESAMMEPDQEVYFVADRPFLFVVEDSSGLVLFSGIVNQVE